MNNIYKDCCRQRIMSCALEVIVTREKARMDLISSLLSDRMRHASAEPSLVHEAAPLTPVVGARVTSCLSQQDHISKDKDMRKY